jgi:hypothetical protein
MLQKNNTAVRRQRKSSSKLVGERARYLSQGEKKTKRPEDQKHPCFILIDALSVRMCMDVYLRVYHENVIKCL